MVGASLFDRTTRNVTLTPEASDFLPVAEKIVGDFDIAIQDIRATAHQRRQRVAIASVYSIATKVLPDVVKDMANRNPDIHVRVRDGNSSDVRRRVRQNEVDFGVGSKDRDDAELEFTPLFRDQLGLLARHDHPLAQSGGSVTWAQLAGWDFIGLSVDTATAPLLEQITDLPESIRLPRYEVSNNSTLWAMIETGLGVTTTPALSEPRPDSNLRFCRLIEPTVWRDVSIIKRRGRMLPPASVEIIRLIKASLSAAAKDNLIEPADTDA
ncbi:LysR family transcriptional regulator [Nitratireductor aquibiodomus RA22]|uniref:LysR family transcriptional regulator n=2 Tax=Nitratireductor aquibiodomus TaxID=204799 RepID=I5BV76_9HYPH|nr:LysR family transcriptional regulator [Nitratireductor aquibiodomus RA22]